MLAMKLYFAMKLHAVAPGGPPEGQFRKTQKLSYFTSFDSPFCTLSVQRQPKGIRLIWVPLGEVDTVEDEHLWVEQ